MNESIRYKDIIIRKCPESSRLVGIIGSGSDRYIIYNKRKEKLLIPYNRDELQNFYDN